MGTSLPEASVSVTSALQGLNDMSIANVVGSNVFNTLLILGLSAVLIPLVIDRDMKIFDIPVMIAIYGVLLLFAFVISPLSIERWEAIVMLVIFILYMVFLVVRAKKSQNSNQTQAELDKELNADELNKKVQPIWLSIIFTVLGLVGIIAGGNFVVNSASFIAKALGMSEALVGLTIVAVGTSLPELVTSVVAAIKKENDIAIGNVVGSNIFNAVFILGLSATISPLAVATSTLTDILVMLGSGVLICLFSFMGKKVARWQGAIMFLAYVAYLAYIIVRN
jgi:cation:H+ antiporter